MTTLRALDFVVRFEWAALLLAAVAGYGFAGYSWTLFLVLILAPDLSMLGYLAGPRAGAIAYNLFHTLVGPLFLLIAGVYVQYDLAIAIATIWIAHIAMDRALGYGLKLSSGFRDTHLGRIGQEPVQSSTSSPG